MKPTVTTKAPPLDGEEFNHPAFGQIRCTRVSGNRTLYDSDFKHQHYISVEILGSSMVRSLSRDWTFERDTKICVAMSEAQWATFVSSMNMGSGVPCTLQRIGVDTVPPIELEGTRKSLFQNEHDQRLSGAVDALKCLENIIDELKISKKSKDELSGYLRRAKSEITSNREFTANQFAEFMESTVEKAKQEIHGYSQFAGLSGSANSLTLENKNDD